MTVARDPSLEPHTVAAFRDAVAIANVPTLLLVLHQLTGNDKWIEPPYRPGRGKGLDDNDTGGLPDAVQAEIRDAALEAILAWKAGKPVAMPAPSDSVLAKMLAASMAEDVPDAYGEIIAAGLGIRERAARPKASRAPAGFKVIIIGAGVSGICAGVRLKQAGIDFEILEKGHSVGGTWRENRYPGAGVDTPNHLYSFSFARHDWSHYFALQDELHAYFRSVAENFGLLDHIRFGTSVTRAAYDEARQRWNLAACAPDGHVETLEASVVISAVGVLNIPKIPAIEGLATFDGPSFHTAEWPADIELEGKRVAVVGNGASAMQVVPAIADQVASMVVFARSKQWAAPFPKFKTAVPDPIRFLLREVPLYQKWYRQRLAWTFNDRIHSSLQKDPEWEHPDRALNAANDAHRRFFTDYVRAELAGRDDLVEKVLPDYPPFGKRMLLDNGWYRTVARDNVELVTEHLKEVRGRTLVAGDGSRYEADILVLGTGFHATEFLASFEIVGRDGQVLRDAWNGDDARAYLGTSVPGFPNFFMLLGPNVGLGHGGSIIAPVEAQMDYVMSLLNQMLERGAAAIEVRRDVHDTYNAKVDAAHDRMVWTHEGMENWYRNSRGRVVAITPWRHDDFWRMTREADLNDYTLEIDTAESAVA